MEWQNKTWIVDHRDLLRRHGRLKTEQNKTWDPSSITRHMIHLLHYWRPSRSAASGDCQFWGVPPSQPVQRRSGSHLSDSMKELKAPLSPTRRTKRQVCNTWGSSNLGSARFVHMEATEGGTLASSGVSKKKQNQHRTDCRSFWLPRSKERAAFEGC